MGNATTSYIHFEISRPLYQDIKYYPRRFFFSIWTFLLFSKWISIIQDHFQKQDGKFCFLYCALYSTVITVRSTNKKLIALYYYYGQTVEAEFVCLFVFLDVFFWLLGRVGYKQLGNAVERLRDSCQWGLLTVLRVALIGNNHATFLQR